MSADHQATVRALMEQMRHATKPSERRRIQDKLEERIPALLRIPARVRFLSCEPLLGPLALDFGQPRFRTADSYHAEIHWVIAGGESGPGARPMDPNWARDLRDECDISSVSFFAKQMGGPRKPFPKIPKDLLVRQFPNGEDNKS